MKYIYFIQNVESYDYFDKNILFPRITTNGIYQCKKLKTYFENLNINIILSSPLRKALETVECVFSDSHMIIASDLLREHLTHPVNNCECRESKENLVKTFEGIDFSQVYDNYNYNNYEDEESINNRMKAFYYYLLNLTYKSIVVVSHENFIKSFLKVYSEKLNNNDCKIFKL